MSDIDGVWETTVNSPMGQQKATLTLKSDGTSLSGTMAGNQGTLDLFDGSVDGDSAKWKANMTSPMPLTLEFDPKVDGDEISGNVKLGAFGNASFNGKRQS